MRLLLILSLAVYFVLAQRLVEVKDELIVNDTSSDIVQKIRLIPFSYIQNVSLQLLFSNFTTVC